jgi:hypothetical protein
MGPHIRKEGWSIWKGRSNHETAYYAEYKNSGPGYAPADRLPWTHQLTDEEAADYTKENIFKADSTTATKLKNDWNPVIAETTHATSATPAFPGAEGRGAMTRGGRGGQVLSIRIRVAKLVKSFGLDRELPKVLTTFATSRTRKLSCGGPLGPRNGFSALDP